jgi:rRNA maturation RNase YbeY
MNKAIRNEGWLEGTINVIFTDNKQIRKLNREYLNRNYNTDVIAFNYNEREKINGDIYISIDTVKSNTALYSTNFTEELLRVIMHGLLHLIGYDDRSPELKKIMQEKEEAYLNNAPA